MKIRFCMKNKHIEMTLLHVIYNQPNAKPVICMYGKSKIVDNMEAIEELNERGERFCFNNIKEIFSLAVKT